jgi:uncharacterized membrane protein YkvA (DUF1232 family)
MTDKTDEERDDGDNNGPGPDKGSGSEKEGLFARLKKKLKRKQPTEAELAAAAAEVKPEDEPAIIAAVPDATAAALKRGADPKLLDGVKTLWMMLKDADYVMPWKTKALVLFGLAYFVSPVDAVPDVVPVAGYMDDFLVIAWVLHRINEEVVAYREARRTSP